MFLLQTYPNRTEVIANLVVGNVKSLVGEFEKLKSNATIKLQSSVSLDESLLSTPNPNLNNNTVKKQIQWFECQSKSENRVQKHSKDKHIENVHNKDQSLQIGRTSSFSVYTDLCASMSKVDNNNNNVQQEATNVATYKPTTEDSGANEKETNHERTEVQSNEFVEDDEYNNSTQLLQNYYEFSNFLSAKEISKHFEDTIDGLKRNGDTNKTENTLENILKVQCQTNPYDLIICTENIQVSKTNEEQKCWTCEIQNDLNNLQFLFDGIDINDSNKELELEDNNITEAINIKTSVNGENVESTPTADQDIEIYRNNIIRELLTSRYDDNNPNYDQCDYDEIEANYNEIEKIIYEMTCRHPEILKRDSINSEDFRAVGKESNKLTEVTTDVINNDNNNLVNSNELNTVFKNNIGDFLRTSRSSSVNVRYVKNPKRKNQVYHHLSESAVDVNNHYRPNKVITRNKRINKNIYNNKLKTYRDLHRKKSEHKHDDNICRTIERLELNYETSNRTRNELLIDEIIDTEKTYGSNLKRIVRDYLPILTRDNTYPLLKENISLIFEKIEQMYIGSINLHRALVRCGYDHDKIAKAFLSFENIFKQYPDYYKIMCKVHEIVTTLKDIIKVRQEELRDRLDLASYLHTPIQRLAQYILLFEKLNKKLQKENQRSTYVAKVLVLIKSTMEKGNNYVAIDSIKGSPINLSEFGTFITQDTFNILKPRKYESMLFLFDEILVFTTTNSKNCEEFIYRDSIRLDEMGMVINEDDKLLFHITRFSTYSDRQIYTIEAKRPNQKIHWVTEINKRLWKQFKHYKENPKPFRKEQRRSVSSVRSRAVPYLRSKSESSNYDNNAHTSRNSHSYMQLPKLLAVRSTFPM